MKHYGRIMLLTLGLGLFAVVLLSIPRHPVAAAATPPAIPVNVENTPSVNAHITNSSIPVTGSVNAAVAGTVGVNNFPAFPSTLTGSTVPVSGTVEVSGLTLGSVTVANTAATPVFVRNIDEPGRQPWTGACTTPQSASATSVSCSFGVPSGQDVVIQTEQFNVLDTLAINKNFQLLITTTCNGCIASPEISIVLPDNGFELPTFTNVNTTEHDTLYASPSSVVSCSAVVPSATTFYGTCVLTGYYVTTP